MTDLIEIIYNRLSRRGPAGAAARSLSLNVRQVEKVTRLPLADLARRAPLFPGQGAVAFLRIDSVQKRVCGHKSTVRHPGFCVLYVAQQWTRRVTATGELEYLPFTGPCTE
jgi:hypothetical protein